jgi:hypothetical protein
MVRISPQHVSTFFGNKFLTRAAIVAIAFLVRAAIMISFIQPNGFYKQADSFDYHNCAISITAGKGMHRAQTNDPIFWRTPGYPLCLAFFYHWFGPKSGAFDANKSAQQAAVWFQIFLASFVPLILFYLALSLTQTAIIATTVAWIGVFHPGPVLASTYLLSEGIALIFFFLFLLFLYQLIIPQPANKRSWFSSALLAALTLSAYTWMRPMGEFVGYFSVLLLTLCSIGPWRQKIKTASLFFMVFFLSLSPWYYRNYQLTGEYFFCPTIGTYLNCFSVPKILRRTLNKPIIECHKIAQQTATLEVRRQQAERPDKQISNNACKNAAFPIISNHPWYFIYDWIAEVIKTTLDLYTYQLIPMFEGSHWYDPIEEYLPEKISACLYAFPLPWIARAICWLEFLFAILLWIGLFGGLWIYSIQPLINKNSITPFTQKMNWIWITTIPMIGIIVGMTGGFGYARLRLPAEPLLIILSLTFWYWLSMKKETKS